MAKDKKKVIKIQSHESTFTIYISALNQAQKLLKKQRLLEHTKRYKISRSWNNFNIMFRKNADHDQLQDEATKIFKMRRYH